MSIICGTDLSEGSRGALEVACALAKLRGDKEVVLVHAVDPDQDEVTEERLESERDAVEKVAASVREVAVRPELMVGAVDEMLTAIADTEGSNLIVIAALSRPRDAAGKHLGATAARVVNRTRVPVIVVRDPAPWIAFAREQRPLRMLLGIDDSVACDVGIQWTHGLRHHGAVDIVLGAIYYPDEAAEHYGLHADTLVDRVPEIERLMARDLVKRFGSTDRVTARPRRGLGRIGDHVCELANEESVDVVLVGTGQKSGFERLGSVSSIIVHEATQSIVCVPPGAPVPTLVFPPVTSALVATDLSAFANRAVPYAFSLTPETGEVHIVHVVDEDAEIDEADVTRQLYALVPTLVKRTVVAHIVRGGDAATMLAQTAARLGADMICIASHGRSGISRALVGSVADRLLRATRKPVLVLRPA